MTTALVIGGIIAALLAAKKNNSVSGVGIVGDLDPDAVREIVLWYENTQDLYFRHHVPLRDSLVRKLKRGVELDINTLAKSSIIDGIVRATLQDYFKNFGSFHVSTATRNQMKREIAERVLEDAYDSYNYNR